MMICNTRFLLMGRWGPTQSGDIQNPATTTASIACNQKNRFYLSHTRACTNRNMLSGPLITHKMILHVSHHIREAPFANSSLSLQIVYGYTPINQTNYICFINSSLREITNQTRYNTHKSLKHCSLISQGPGVLRSPAWIGTVSSGNRTRLPSNRTNLPPNFISDSRHLENLSDSYIPGPGVSKDHGSRKNLRLRKGVGGPAGPRKNASIKKNHSWVPQAGDGSNPESLSKKAQGKNRPAWVSHTARSLRIQVWKKERNKPSRAG
mmetsp:Transcript_93831/g.162461  ORF Transcript_93831/g.162461 Transcript_93831/m.162461 type:complete len:265 (+) Transcript_93831:351-1145(+)